MLVYLVMAFNVISDFMDFQVRLKIEDWSLIFKYDFRGAPVNENEKKRLNDLGGKILREAGLDFEELKNYDWIKKETFDDGYAGYYLRNCWNAPKLTNEADVEVYKRLVDIDTNLGTKLSLQLWRCLRWTTRWDILKVWKFY